MSAPTSIDVKAGALNSASVFLGTIGGSGGIELEAGEPVTIDFPDPTLWEIRVGTGDTAKLTATEPV